MQNANRASNARNVTFFPATPTNALKVTIICARPYSVKTVVWGILGLVAIAGLIELLWFRPLREISNEANRPIEFYGICLDQDDNPVPSVEVEFQIRWSKKIWPLGISDVFKNPVVTTGTGGRFSLTGELGSLLVVKSLHKAGYEPSQKSLNQSFWYWHDPRDVFHPDAARPVVYRLWKKRGAERLATKGIGLRIPYDGTPVELNLLEEGRQPTVGGDLRVTLLRDPLQIKPGQRNFDWTVTLEIPSGGLLVSDAEQAYFAPASGYQQQLTISMKADDPQWADSKTLQVYFKLRDRLFGRGELKVFVDSDRPEGTPFYFTSYINPSGSQNLEYDSLQDSQGWHPATSPAENGSGPRTQP